MDYEPCDAIYRARPEWATGYIGWHDARFLYTRIRIRQPELVVEIGTASGISTAIAAAAAPHVDTWDIAERFYADRNRHTGDAAREMLPPELLERVTFRKGTVRDLPYPPDSLDLAFIDADHRHPWPCLDLLGILDHMRAGSEILLHDINLPLTDSASNVTGAKILYDGLDLHKTPDPHGTPPNIGSIFIPANKDSVRKQLRALIDRHPWETETPYPGKNSTV